jgi:hypothetical protein
MAHASYVGSNVLDRLSKKLETRIRLAASVMPRFFYNRIRDDGLRFDELL